MTIRNFPVVFVSLLILSVVLCGCSGQGGKPKTDTSAIDVEQWSKDFGAAWASHDVDKILSFYTDDCIYEDVVVNKVNHGKEELRAFIKDFFAGSPDMKIETKSFFASGNHVCMEWVFSGTHSGNWTGMPATGKSFSVRGVSVSELMEGKVKQNTDYYDSVSFMQQLGLLPPAMAANPFVGLWKLNVAKSKFDPGPPHKSEMIRIEVMDNGLKHIFDTVPADGKAQHVQWSAIFDGKDYPVTGDPGADQGALKRIDANNCEAVFKKNGKQTGRWRVTVSKDGKILTATGKGESFNNTQSYEKQ